MSQLSLFGFEEPKEEPKPEINWEEAADNIIAVHRPESESEPKEDTPPRKFVAISSKTQGMFLKAIKNHYLGEEPAPEPAQEEWPDYGQPAQSEREARPWLEEVPAAMPEPEFGVITEEELDGDEEEGDYLKDFDEKYEMAPNPFYAETSDFEPDPVEKQPTFVVREGNDYATHVGYKPFDCPEKYHGFMHLYDIYYCYRLRTDMKRIEFDCPLAVTLRREFRKIPEQDVHLLSLPFHPITQDINENP